MIRRFVILFFLLNLTIQLSCLAQNFDTQQAGQMLITRGWVEPNGDTIPWIQLRTVHIFKELKFKKKKDYAAPGYQVKGRCIDLAQELVFDHIHFFRENGL